MEYNFKVNLGGMIDILSNHLYSSPKVFIRELLQNGTDAISARQKENPQFKDGRITIHVIENKTIRFCDNGTGLTEEEIHGFLAVIGQSSKRDLDNGQIYEDYIGRFGIGLLSCFMVTDEITIRTRSVKTPETAHEWRGKPDGTYEIKSVNADNINLGTEVIINAKADSKLYFHNDEIISLVRYYGLPLPFPVILSDNSTEIIINRLHSNSNLMELGKTIFGEEFIDCIPLESGSGLFSGVAYILPYPVAANAEHKHRIYLKNMLLTEDGGRILPKWAFFIKCFLNSSILRPTASRENFYEDENLKEARTKIAECISDYLLDISENNSALLARIISIHSLAIKSIAVEDEELFKTFIPHLEFQTIFGIMNGDELTQYDGNLFYTDNINKYRQLAPVFASQMKLLVNAGYTYDAKLLKILSELNDDVSIKHIENIEPEDFLDDVSRSEQERAAFLLEIADEVLEEFGCAAGLKSFEPESLPVFYLVSESAELFRDIRRMRTESDNIFSSMFDAFEEELDKDDSHSTLYFNANNTLVQKIINTHDEDKIATMVQILYVQALLTGHFPVSGDDLELLNDGIIKLMEDF
ncbi:MAG: HSP90 family protein [Oscillospiraceae bacterium]|nr:HSP90 family protein [Oscillospiraceae bacterium]